MGHLPHELVRRPHTERTFEDVLRDALHDAPYLGAALLVHAIALLVLAQLHAPPPPVEPQTRINVAPEAPLAEPLPPPPERREPEPVEPEPTLMTETPVDSPDDLDADADSTELPGPDGELFGNDPSLLGIGGLTGRGGDGRGPPGGRNDVVLAADDPVRRGLLWLAHHQHPDGHWSAAAFDAQCGRQGDDVVCDGTGSPLHDVGVSALALLAFLGAGNTDRHGEFRDTVRAGLRFLADVQAADGNFGDARSGQHTYDHLLATLAFVDAYGQSRSSLLRLPTERALRCVERMRNPGEAWRYASFHPEMDDPARRNDTSVTGWALLVLAEAREAGLDVDARAIDDGLRFLDEMTEPSTGRVGYVEPGSHSARERGRDEQWPPEQSEALTAVALMARAFADPDLERPGARERLAQGAELIARLPPLWSDEQPGRRDFYFWYYGTYALYQYSELDPRPWKRWQDRMLDAIASHQHVAGERAGSWDPQVDPWGHIGGRVYSTAILTLCLEVYYRYPTVLGQR